MLSKQDASASQPKDSDVLFRIPLSAALHKVDLPPLDIWNKLDSATSNLQDLLSIQVRKRGFFVDSESSIRWVHCVASPKGYLVVYLKEEKLRGYALDISLAKKIVVESLGKKYAKRKGWAGGEKDYTTVELKMKNGSLKLLLAPDDSSSKWIDMLLSFSSQKSPTNCAKPPLQLSPVNTVTTFGAASTISETSIYDGSSDGIYDVMTLMPSADSWDDRKLSKMKLERAPVVAVGSVDSLAATIKSDSELLLPANLDSLMLIPSVTILSPEHVAALLRKIIAAIDAEKEEAAEHQK